LSRLQKGSQRSSYAYAELVEALGRDKLPEHFHWKCECGQAGFPGCPDFEHFCQRVYLSLVDYHQMAETQRRQALRQVDGQMQCLRLKRLSKSCKRRLRSDVQQALRIVRRYAPANDIQV